MKYADPEPPNLKKYGVPLYSVAWVPPEVIRLQQNPPSDEVSGDDAKSDPPSEPEVVKRPGEKYLAFAGGGGEGRSGIPNALLVAHFHVESNLLSDQPVRRLGTDSDLPYRMAVNPRGDGIICAMPNGCRWFEWDRNDSAEIHKLSLKKSEKVLTQLEDVGQQLALAFNNDGTALATGGEDGNLRVFKWPSMEIIHNETRAHSTVKDLHFSSDGKLLASLGSAGPCRVWDLSSTMVLTSLPNENREVFSSCRFSQNNSGTQVLYVAAMSDKGGSIVTWDTKTWERTGSKRILLDPISALNVTADGKFLACGTISGDIVVVNSTNMQIWTKIKNAHLGIVTALAFSPDSRALASASLDSSARVTIMEDKKKNGGSGLWITLFIIFLAIVVYCLRHEGIVK
ncbi:hypothetical protein L6164_026734 [Bauhinia variegata]|uniref:Uncharacterized protein n=1 Tax=Bauhinia variegata TaxID=167791 RepID=A0ACB9LQU4_BAUVA|nr:hypothetical protein L6164_026734 [Bauhinia variegata]